MDELMVTPVRIAVLMTSHNRRSTTLQALAALWSQTFSEDVRLTVYLVDDGSTDGTAEAVRVRYPQVQVLAGTGTLFWNGGMRAAFAAAARQPYDYHLWLNDDTILSQSALETLLETARTLQVRGFADATISGATRDPRSQVLVSGGFRQRWPKFLLRFGLLEPMAEARQCDTISGNCVLVPRAIYQKVGNFNAAFTHFLGDLDYGFRAKQLGYSVWLAPGYAGTSPQHHERGNEIDAIERFSTLVQKLRHPKGLSYGNDLQHRFLPVGEWTRFLQDHGGILWPIPWLLTYRKLLSLTVGRWLWKWRAKLTPQSHL
ncbi:glycosyltransferase family 2 protein [Altericista sp. CCNU0014]|uniref:glycosyltransferase family 2 protein n=1 Tax=Altericista sp. CCNU0014 TaxID=3082949 RepID=UPI0038509208